MKALILPVVACLIFVAVADIEIDIVSLALLAIVALVLMAITLVLFVATRKAGAR